jgi:hypothetical protein
MTRRDSQAEPNAANGVIHANRFEFFAAYLSQRYGRYFFAATEHATAATEQRLLHVLHLRYMYRSLSCNRACNSLPIYPKVRQILTYCERARARQQKAFYRVLLGNRRLSIEYCRLSLVCRLYLGLYRKPLAPLSRKAP